MYSSIATTGFPGLDLVSSPDEAGCIDLLNVDFDRRGAVRVRDGYDNFTTSAAAADYDSLCPTADAGKFLAGRGTSLDLINDAGGVDATTTSITSGWSSVRFGIPSSERTYIGNQGGIQRLVGTTFTTPAGMPKARIVAVQPGDNRLVGAHTSSADGPGGAASSLHHVWFSDAGAPETWGANNYVQLTPGDGDAITAVITWRDQLFVFKERRFFVFYGNSTDSAGNPIFNYRTIDAGVGAATTTGATNQSAIAAPDGVYFWHYSGVYRTSGGPPELVSGAIAPIFDNTASSFWQGGVLADTFPGAGRLAYHQGRIYAAWITSGGSFRDRIAVYDIATDAWTMWGIPANSLLGLPGSSTYPPRLYFAYSTGLNHVGRISSSYTTDDGTAIVSRYRSGFSDLGSDDEKSIANVELWGTGTVNYQLSKDFGSLDTATSVALGTSPAIARGRAARRGGIPGTLYSWQVGASSGAWALHRAVHRVSANKPPAAKSA